MQENFVSNFAIPQVHPSGGIGKAPLSLNFQCRHVRRMLSINSGGTEPRDGIDKNLGVQLDF